MKFSIGTVVESVFDGFRGKLKNKKFKIVGKCFTNPRCVCMRESKSGFYETINEAWLVKRRSLLKDKR
jgi:hypothetical protein